MLVQSGSKEGKTTQELVLKEPDWVQFFLSKNKTGKVPTELNRHIKTFDAKPLVEKCTRCKGDATRATLYVGNALLPYYWCDDCDPYSSGARAGTLTVVHTYAQALRFVDHFCSGKRSDKRAIIRELGQAKGLPKRVGASAARSFLP